MAQRLLDECLKVPALRRDFRIEEAEANPKLRERRERDELRSTTLRMENEKQRVGRHERGDLAHRDELERSIAELKRQLKVETKTVELRTVLLKRVMQSSFQETPLSRAALSERDRLATEVLKLHWQLSQVETDEELIKESQSRTIRKSESAATQEQERRKRSRVDNDKLLAMKSERAALRALFFTLIMESGVDWLSDDELRKVVWSIR